MSKWIAEAARLYGYRLGSAANQKAVATALEQIDAILRANGDVEIIVKRAGLD